MNHILIADDDPSIRRLLERALSQEGYPVETASTGREVLAKIEQKQPVLLLLDLEMPVMSGWDVYSRLHDNGRSDIPVVVLTADDNLVRTKRALSGATVLGKPFDLEELFQTIGRYYGPGDRAPVRARQTPARHEAAGQQVLALVVGVTALRLARRLIPGRFLLRTAWRATRLTGRLLFGLAHLPFRAGRGIAARQHLSGRPARDGERLAPAGARRYLLAPR
jgi:CheY-like chemotaxis protein